MTLINRYIMKVKPSIFKLAKIGEVILSENGSEAQGFIANTFKKTKSIEICLFKHTELNSLNIPDKNILYYESNYDSKTRYKEIQNQ